MHDRITVASAEKNLPQTQAQILRECMIDNLAFQMAQWHEGIDNTTVDVSRTLWTGRVAVTGYFQLIFIDDMVIKQLLYLYCKK